jgi:predicted protein tyrosine phosphatase
MQKYGVIKNPHQGSYKRVLCVCSGGILRSATAAVVLAGEPFNFNTRNAGCDDYHALIPVTEELVVWADEIVFMQDGMRQRIAERFDLDGIETQVLDIPDSYAYRDDELIELIKESYMFDLVKEAMDKF